MYTNRIRINEIQTHNSKIQEGDLLSGIKEMRKLLSSAEKSENAYSPKKIRVKVIRDKK